MCAQDLFRESMCNFSAKQLLTGGVMSSHHVLGWKCLLLSQPLTKVPQKDGRKCASLLFPKFWRCVGGLTGPGQDVDQL